MKSIWPSMAASVLLRTAIWGTLGMLGFASPPVLSQGRDMGCSPTVANPCSGGNNSGPRPDYSPPVHVPQGPTFQERSSRYQSIREYLTAAGSQAARNLVQQPRTPEELSLALATMELELLREIGRLKYDLSRHEKEVSELSVLIPSKTKDLNAKRAFLVEVRALAEANQSTVAKLKQDIGVWDQRGTAVYQRAKLAAERLRVNQKEIFSLMNAMTPKDRFVAGPGVVDASPALVGPRSQRKAAPVVMPVDVRPAPAPAALNVGYPPLIASAPPGSDDDRIMRLGDLGSVFDAVARRDRRAVQTLVEKRPVLDNLLRQLSEIEAVLSVASKENENARFTAEAAHKQLLASKGSYLDSRRELVKVASVEWAWKAWRTKVVLPAVHAYAKENALDKFLEPVGTGSDSWWRVKDLNMERDFPKPLKNWNSFFKVQHETLGLLKDPELFVNHAARLAAFGSPEEMKRYAEELFRGLDDKSVRLAKAAGRVKVPGGTQAFAAMIFDWSRDEKTEYELQ